MANGTIAFDTLTTSDSVKSGTEKSIDTSYIFNGSAKAWLGAANHSSGAILGDTFNISSYEDTATARGRPTMTNAVSGDYCVLQSTESLYPYVSFNVSSTVFEVSSVNSSGSFTDGVINAAVFGVLV